MPEIGDAYVTIGARTAEFQKKMMQVETRFQKVGANLSKAGSKMSRNLTAPLLAIGGLSAKMGFDFFKAVERTNTMMKLAGEESAQFRKGVLSVSREYGKSATDIATAAYTVSSVLHLTGQDMITTLEATTAAAKTIW